MSLVNQRRKVVGVSLLFCFEVVKNRAAFVCKKKNKKEMIYRIERTCQIVKMSRVQFAPAQQPAATATVRVFGARMRSVLFAINDYCCTYFLFLSVCKHVVVSFTSSTFNS